MAGQYWALLGWQPYYFIPSVRVAPVPAMLYSRTVQSRGIHGFDLGDQTHGQVALGDLRCVRPSATRVFRHSKTAFVSYTTAGSRASFLALPHLKAPCLSASESRAPFVSFPVPRTWNGPRGAMTHYVGSGLAIDTCIPIIPAKDKKDVRKLTGHRRRIQHRNRIWRSIWKLVGWTSDFTERHQRLSV